MKWQTWELKRKFTLKWNNLFLKREIIHKINYITINNLVGDNYTNLLWQRYKTNFNAAPASTIIFKKIYSLMIWSNYVYIIIQENQERFYPDTHFDHPFACLPHSFNKNEVSYFHHRCRFYLYIKMGSAFYARKRT